MIGETAPVERAKPAQAIGTTRLWSRTALAEGEEASEPLPGPLEVFLVFVVEADQDAEGEGEWCLERAVVG